MQAIDNRDFAAVVMLYQLDTLYFPRLADDNDWLGKLEDLATTKRLHASDGSAVQALVEFAGTAAGQADRPRVSQLLDQLVARYPTRTAFAALQYKLLAAGGDAQEAELRAVLERVARLRPDNTAVYAYLVQYHGADDIAQTYETIRAWLQRDTRRRELLVIRQIFEK
jgi:hypothetical protein